MAEPAGRSKADLARRRRWAGAAVVSLAVHGLVVLGLALTTPRGGPMREPPVFEVSLERLAPPTPLREPEPLRRATSPSSPIRIHQPSDVAPGAPTSGLPAGAGQQTVAPPGPIASPPPPSNPKLKLDCLHMGPRARTGVYGREDCEVQKFAKVQGSEEVFKPPVNAAWDAQVAKQMRIHEPLPRGQEPRMDCPGANLGLGCSDEALSYSTKRRF